LPHHARKPSSESVVRCRSSVVRNSWRPAAHARSRRSSDLNHFKHAIRNRFHPLRRMGCSRIDTHNASEPSLSDLGACAQARTPKQGLRYTRHTLPVRHQTDNGTSCRRSVLSCRKTDNATSNRQPDCTRPETHQNLIYPDKEQNHRYHGN